MFGILVGTSAVQCSVIMANKASLFIYNISDRDLINAMAKAFKTNQVIFNSVIVILIALRVSPFLYLFIPFRHIGILAFV